MKKLILIFCVVSLYATAAHAYTRESRIRPADIGYNDFWTVPSQYWYQRSFRVTTDVTHTGTDNEVTVTPYYGNIWHPGENLSTMTAIERNNTDGYPNSYTFPAITLTGVYYWHKFHIDQEMWKNVGSFPYVDNWVRIDLY